MPSAADAAGQFNQFVGFGDSTLDSGYFRYNSTGSAPTDAAIAAAVANGASGAFVGPGVMDSIMLGSRFGLNASAIGGGGTNYAVGGSYADAPKAGTISATGQMRNYLASVGGSANPNALYVVSSGYNDVVYTETQGAAWRAANPNYLTIQANALAAAVASLQAAGARWIVVPNSYNSAVFAGPGGTIAAANADEYARSSAYWSTLWSRLTTLGVHFIPADMDSVFRFVVQHPTYFGFTAYSVQAANAPTAVSALTATSANVTPAQMQSFLFIDGKHVTTAGQQIEADYIFSLLAAPSMISMLAEAPVQGGLGRAATIQAQMELPGQERGESGVNVWVSGSGGTSGIANAPGFPDSSGNAFSGSAGADWRMASGLILGGAFTSGYQTQRFSMSGGRFDQTDQALSLYAAHRAGRVWGNVVASYGMYQDRIHRDVPLGTFIDNNSGSASGQSLALALRIGGDIVLGPVTTGPVAGLVLQQVHIDSFTETGVSGVTALSFGAQTRNSLVSQLGWRASVDMGKWRPFAEAKWNHELANTDRDVEASLTSIAALTYSMPAVPVTADWGTGTLGTTFRLSERTLLRGAASAALVNPQGFSYGGELGLIVRF